MIINHNVPALVTNNALSKATINTDKSSKKLSTGKRINSAADDAAGLAISNKMQTQILGLKMADRNCNDAVALIQTAEGGMAEIQNMLQRMRELAIQGSNDTLTGDDSDEASEADASSSSDRQKIQDEVCQLIDEIDATSQKIQYNTKPLLDGTYENLVFQIGQNQGLFLSVEMEAISATIDEESGSGLGLKGGQALDGIMDGLTDTAGEELTAQWYTPEDSEDQYLSYQNIDACNAAIVAVDAAIDLVSSFRSKLGAVQNRLEYTSSAIGVSSENAESAMSRIQDTNMASEMTEYTKNNVIVQTGVAMLAQANQRPNQVLQLLQ